MAAFARTNLLTSVHNAEYAQVPDWFSKWEETGLIRFADKNQDGRIQYYNDQNPAFADRAAAQGWNGNELHIDRDIIVLANPEIARLPAWVVALVAGRRSGRSPCLRPPVCCSSCPPQSPTT